MDEEKQNGIRDSINQEIKNNSMNEENKKE